MSTVYVDIPCAECGLYQCDPLDCAVASRLSCLAQNLRIAAGLCLAFENGFGWRCGLWEPGIALDIAKRTGQPVQSKPAPGWEDQ